MRGGRIVWLLALLASAACGKESGSGGGAAPSGSSASSSKTDTPKGPVTLSIAYGSEKKTWFEEESKAFLAQGPRTKSGRPIHIDSKAMGSGEAVQGILSGKLKPHVFSPASGAYVLLLNQSWLSAGGHTRPIAVAGDPLVLSPVVIAMWKPMAEAIGWPKKRIGWRDLLAINADKRGWGAHGHPEWGRFKLGHTHPEYSNSGLLVVLAEAYAGAKKVRGLELADLDAKATQAFIADVEQTIVHYGKSTGFFAEKMQQRGPEYMSAAVLYENLVIESYGKQGAYPLVAIYPTEGTFWSDHPWSVLDAEWVGADEKDAADQLLAFLKAKPAQQRALELGFRPADPSIAIGAPVDAAHGVDPKQPETLLDVPDGATLAKLLEVWKQNKKTTDVILVFDKSGSMRGTPLETAKTGARTFLGTLHDSDEVTLMFFDGRVYEPYGPVKLGEGRDELVGRIDGVIAGGGTALYEAISAAYQMAAKRAEKEPGRIHAVVVMTDGRDEGSKLQLAGLEAQLSGEAADAVKVFTIAYGDAADTRILAEIADKAKGASAKGTVETIVQVFEDMGAFF